MSYIYVVSFIIIVVVAFCLKIIEIITLHTFFMFMRLASLEKPPYLFGTPISTSSGIRTLPKIPRNACFAVSIHPDFCSNFEGLELRAYYECFKKINLKLDYILFSLLY